MSITFSADEIFEIAQQIERNGAKFYRKAAETVEGENRNLLLRLAEMEDQHEKTFAAIRAELASDQQFPKTFDPDNQAALYLQALADGKIFDVDADPAERLTGTDTPREILSTAIGLEEDSVVFYESIKEMVPATQAERVGAIIKEEIGHIVDLAVQLSALGK